MAEQVALWYWRYHSLEFSLEPSEEKAAGLAAAMREDGGGSPAGVQFQDGCFINADNWTALAEAVKRRDEAWDRRDETYIPPEMKTIQTPWGKATVLASSPEWLGPEVTLHA